MITVTLDTNVLIEYWLNRKNTLATESLLNLAQQGKIDLAITSRISADIPDLPLANRINELPKLGVRQIGSVFRFDCSTWDDGDMWGSNDFSNAIDSLEDEFDRQGRTKKRPDWRDWDHLHGHYLKKRQVFLTWDRPILEVASALQEQLGMVVSTPQEFLDSQTELTRNSQRRLHTKSTSSKPLSPGTQG